MEAMLLHKSCSDSVSNVSLVYILQGLLAETKSNSLKNLFTSLHVVVSKLSVLVACPEAAAIHQHEDIRSSPKAELLTSIWVGWFLCRSKLFGLHLVPPFQIESFAALCCWFG